MSGLFNSADARATEQTTTATGTQNDVSISGPFTYLRCNNASPLTLTGFSASGATPSAGQRIIVDNIGSSTVKVAHQDAGSTAAYRVIAPSTNGQIIGANGRMELVYDGTTGRWRESLVDPGTAIPVTFSAGNFTGSGAMTWTVAAGDQQTFSYQQWGTLLYVWLEIKTSTVGGTPDQSLHVAMPGGFTCALAGDMVVLLADNGSFQFGIAGSHSSDLTKIRFVKLSGNWSAATDTTWAKAYPLIMQVT